MTRQYETVYIFDSALEETQVNEHLERFHELLKVPDASTPVSAMAHWGKRTLAYPIKNKEVGYYVVAKFETAPDRLPEYERAIKLDEQVLRYLVVVNEGPQPVPAQAARTDGDSEGDD